MVSLIISLGDSIYLKRQEQVKLKQQNKALVDKIIKQWFRYTKAWKQHDVTKIVNAMIVGLHLPKQMKYYISPGGIG